MGRPKKEEKDRKYIAIQIYFEDYLKLVKGSKKNETFAEIIHDLLEERVIL